MFPMALKEHEEWTRSIYGTNRRALIVTESRGSKLRSGWRSTRQVWWKVLVWNRSGANAVGVRGRGALSVTILLSLVALMVLDLFCNSITLWMLIQTSEWSLLVWIFLPPLTQALGLIMGPIFVLAENPVLGRIYASLILASAVVAPFTTVLLMAFTRLRDSSALLFTMSFLATLARLALSYLANKQVRNLEAFHDLACIPTPDEAFIDRIVGRAIGMAATNRIPLSLASANSDVSSGATASVAELGGRYTGFSYTEEDSDGEECVEVSAFERRSPF